MKTVNRFRLLIMAVLAILVFTISVDAQSDYGYIDLSLDANKVTGIKNNPRTETNNRGLDWKLEMGARDTHVGVYVFGGAFEPIDYIIYGAGVDYYLFPDTKGIDILFGGYYSVVIRRDVDGNSGSFASYLSPRARATYWINNLGINVTYRGQGRKELGTMVHEVSVGLTFKIDK